MNLAQANLHAPSGRIGEPVRRYKPKPTKLYHDGLGAAVLARLGEPKYTNEIAQEIGEPFLQVRATLWRLWRLGMVARIGDTRPCMWEYVASRVER